LEAARLAAQEEEAHKAGKETRQAAKESARQAEAQRQAIRDELTLSDRVDSLLPRLLGGVGHIYVANALAVDHRDVLRALWKAHRAKFCKEGEIERAVGASAVIHAIDHTPPGQLVASHIVTDASDYLVWLDMADGSVVAAFANARAYFA
jgi:hypothetical protein